MRADEFQEFLAKAQNWTARVHGAVEQRAFDRANEVNDFARIYWPMVDRARMAVEAPHLYRLDPSVSEGAPRGEIKCTPQSVAPDSTPKTTTLKVMLEHGTVSFVSEFELGNTSLARSHVTEEWVQKIVRAFVAKSFQEYQMQHNHLL